MCSVNTSTERATETEQQVGIVTFTSEAEAGAEPGREDRQDRAEGPDPGSQDGEGSSAPRKP